MDPRFAQLPHALRERSLITPLAASTNPAGEAVPALLAHPDPHWWQSGAAPTPAPVVLWMHGRTVNKELDPGRYLRWIRAGIGACAIDLPGHGERAHDNWSDPNPTLQIIEQAVTEIDSIIRALDEPRFNGAFDTTRIGIGGMSTGGMIALYRLTQPHAFSCCTVEAAAGDFEPLRGRSFYIPERADPLNPIRSINGWRPIPFLALHSESDRWVPFACMTNFVDALRMHYAALGADPADITLQSWPETGAPEEHMGFGRVSNEAKNIQTAFLARSLGAVPTP